MSHPLRYNYSFSVWPEEQRNINAAMFTLFEFMPNRFEVIFTEEQFNEFRSGLAVHYLTLREIEQVPYREPENIP